MKIVWFSAIVGSCDLQQVVVVILQLLVVVVGCGGGVEVGVVALFVYDASVIATAAADVSGILIVNDDNNVGVVNVLVDRQDRFCFIIAQNFRMNLMVPHILNLYTNKYFKFETKLKKVWTNLTSKLNTNCQPFL